MATGGDRVLTRHPDPGKKGTRIEGEIYRAFRKAILRAVPRRASGTPFRTLPQQVRTLLPAGIRARVGSVSWYTVTVKLDLEARGLIERVPGVSPQHLRRRQGAAPGRPAPSKSLK